MKIKQILIVISILLVASIVGYNFGISKTGSFKSILESSEEHHSPPSVVIEPGSAVETASYIIFKDDEGWIYAKNGDTGEIEFKDTDASCVINTAISQLKNGGKIFIKAGTYTISNSIDFGVKSIILEGEGWGYGTTRYPYEHPVTLLQTDKGNLADYVIKAGSTSNYAWGIQIRNLGIYGNWDESCLGGIYFENVGFSVIENVYIAGLLKTDAGSEARGICMNRSNNLDANHNQIRNVWMRRCAIGIEFKSLSQGHHIHGLTIWGNADAKTLYGIVLDNSNGNRFWGTNIGSLRNSNSVAIWLKNKSDRNRFYNPRFENDYGFIKIDLGADDNLFHGGIFGTLESGGYKVSNSGSGNVFENMWGFVTENSGTVTGTSPITVTHGLVGTPNVVTVTPTSDAGDFYVTNEGDTTFQIAFDGGGTKTFYWHAVYKP